MTLMMIIGLSTLFICTFIITVNNSKIYFEDQLQRNAQDTATALGLSMSKQQPNQKIDTTIMLSTISAVFDRGNFSSILVRNTEGVTLVKRYLKANSHDVPNWFITLVSIKNEAKSALIMRGWQQVGEVVVQSENSVAYVSLWHTAKKLCLLFLLTTLLIIVLSVLFIKARFRPLQQIVQQADDIGKKNLYILDSTPKPKELRKLSTTMNSMVAKLQAFFTMQIEEIERLRAEAYQDSLTGKGNRRYFFQQFNQYLSKESYFLPGFLFLIELSGLAEFNQRHGYQEGDQVILGVSRYLDELFPHQHLFLLARLDGPSFAAVILEQDRQVIESLLSDLARKLEKFIKNKDSLLSCYVGVVRCRFAEPSTNLLANADKIIRVLQNEGGATYCIEAEERDGQSLDNYAWLSIIELAIQKKAFNFYYQPVKFHSGIYHKECFIKLLNDSNEIGANVFFPIVEQYSLGSDIDELVLEKISKIKDDSALAINLSNSTVGDAKKQEQFLSLLKKWTQHIKIKIHFEFSEFVFAENKILATLFVDELVKLGHTVGLDRVGATLTSLNYLKDLNLAYVKLDGSLSADIEKNTVKQDLITHWIITTERLDITLIATAIESENQWRLLNQLGITYFQGNYIQSPSLIRKK